MKKTIVRILMTGGTALFFAFSAWTTVSAAKATSRFLVSKFVGTAATPAVTKTPMDTSTPVVNGTQQATDDDQDKSVTSGTTGGPQLSENDDQDDGSAVTSGTTGSTQMGKDDSEEHNNPVMTGTPQPGNSSDEEHHNNNNGGSGSGSDNGGGVDD